MSDDNVRTCGRPTRAGTPCKTPVYGSNVACGTHATEHDRELAEAHRRGWREGREAGRSGAAGVAEARAERLERRVKELEQQLDDATRVHEIDGAQAVEVDGYAYLWRGSDPLKVGDQVMLPENYISRLKRGPGPFPGTVTRLGATYRGNISAIVRRSPQNHH